MTKARAKHKAECIIQDEERDDAQRIMNTYFFMRKQNESQIHKAKTIGDKTR